MAVLPAEATFMWMAVYWESRDGTVGKIGFGRDEGVTTPPLKGYPFWESLSLARAEGNGLGRAAS